MYILKKSKHKSQKNKSKAKKSKNKQKKSRKSLQKSVNPNLKKKISKNDNKKIDFDKIVKTLDRDLQQVYSPPHDNKKIFNFQQELDDDNAIEEQTNVVIEETNFEKHEDGDVDENKSNKVKQNININIIDPTVNLEKQSDENALIVTDFTSPHSNLNVNKELKLKYDKFKLEFLE